MDLTSELRAYIHTFKQIREAKPDLPADDPFFVGSLEAESNLYAVIDSMVREFRQESTLAAAMEEAAQNLLERREVTEQRASAIFFRLQDAFLQIRAETKESPVFHGKSYSLTLAPPGFLEFAARGNAEKPIHDRVGAKKVEALYLRKLEIKAIVDQIKAEERILAERRRGLLSEDARIDQDVLEEVPSLITPGTKTAKLPMVDITIRDLEGDVVITDEDVLDDQYMIEPPPPPLPKKVPNIPALLMALKSGVNVLGAHIGNGKKSVAYRAKKSS
jgi:hypothetical protein